MKQKLFNVLVYSMLVYSLVNAGYLALPVELQEMIPQYNQLVAIVSGGATGLLALGGLKVQDYLNRAKQQADDKFILLSQNYLNLERKYDMIENAYKSMQKYQEETTKAVEYSNKLIKVDLEAKLSNPLIDEKVQELIEGVIKDE